MSRDLTIPFTEAELDEFKVAFQKLPSYSDGSVPSTDLPVLCGLLGFERTPEQYQAYIQYWDKVYDGRIPLTEAINILKVMHDNAKFFLEHAQTYDKNGDGFISDDEFEQLIEMMVLHEPKIKTVKFEDFVAAADTNKDGLVSLQECAVWIERIMGTPPQLPPSN